MKEDNKNGWGFCETPDEKCTMNYCDENGCQNRKRFLIDPKQDEEFKQEPPNETFKSE